MPIRGQYPGQVIHIAQSEADGNIILVSGQGVETGDAHQDAEVLEAECPQRLLHTHLPQILLIISSL